MELMVTVALLAMMSAMTAVGLQPLLARFRLRQASDTTAQLLIRTRQRAIETGRCHQIALLADGLPVTPGSPADSLRVSRRRDADCESDRSLALVEVERIPLPERIPLRQPEPGSLVFRPTGRTADNASWRFHVGAPELTRTVLVTPHGPVCTLEGLEEECP